MTDESDNTNINYGMGGTGSYVSRSSGADANDILSGETKEYMKSLASVAATPPSMQTTNADYYPDGDPNVIKGYYEGSILGRMPLVASSMMIPFAAFDKKAEQEKFQKQAQDNLYMQSLHENYSHIKDAVKDRLFGEQQFGVLEGIRKQYTDQLGEYKGTIAFKNSADYSKAKWMFNNFANTFDDTFDTATKIRAEYESGGGTTFTTKETEKGDIETGESTATKETQQKYPENYISQSTYEAARKFQTASMQKDVSLDDIKDLLKYREQMQMGVGIDKSVASIASTLSKDATYKIYQLKGTAATDQKVIEETTGASVDKWAYQVDDKGNIKRYENGKPIYSDNFDRFYKRWSYDAPERQPDKEDVVSALRDQTTHQVKAKIENAATDAAAFEKNRIAMMKESRESAKTHPTIQPTPTTLYINGKAVQSKANYDIGSSAKGNNNIVNLSTYGKNTASGSDKMLQGNYEVSNVYVDENDAVRAIVKQPAYTAVGADKNPLTRNEDGDYVDAKGNPVSDDAVKFVKNPTTNESFDVPYNTVSSTINTNFTLNGLPQSDVKTSGRNGEVKKTISESDLESKAKASGYTSEEYKELLIKNGVTITK